jgi:WD40 repeat protein
MPCCDPASSCIISRRGFLQGATIVIAGGMSSSHAGLVSLGSAVSERVYVMRWHSHSHKLVAASDGMLQVIDPDSGQVERRMSLEPQKILDLAFDPSGQRLLVAGGDPSQRGIVELRSWPSGELLQSYVTEGDVVTRLAWSSNGERWLEGDWNGGCRIRHVSHTPDIEYFGHTRTVLAAAWSATHPWVATAGVESSIQLWNPDDGNTIRRLDQHTRSVVALEFTQPDPAQAPYLVSAGEDATLRLWQPGIGRLVRFARLPSIPLAIARFGSGLTYAVAFKSGHIVRVDLNDVSVQPLQETGVEDRIQAIATNETGDRLHVMRQSGLRLESLRTSE